MPYMEHLFTHVLAVSISQWIFPVKHSIIIKKKVMKELKSAISENYILQLLQYIHFHRLQIIFSSLKKKKKKRKKKQDCCKTKGNPQWA